MYSLSLKPGWEARIRDELQYISVFKVIIVFKDKEMSHVIIPSGMGGYISIQEATPSGLYLGRLIFPDSLLYAGSLPWRHRATAGARLLVELQKQ